MFLVREFFPGADLLRSEASGRVLCRFWIWHYEVSMSITIHPITYAEKIGDTAFMVYMKSEAPKVSTRIETRSIKTEPELREALKWVQEYVDGIRAALDMIYVPRIEEF
jgi:hypothetical protein